MTEPHDIVLRLRNFQVRRRDGTGRPTPRVCLDAADEIERLRARITQLLDMHSDSIGRDAAIARELETMAGET